MLEDAPKYLRDRYYSLRSYAWHSLFTYDDYINKINSFETKKRKALFKKNANDLIDEVGVILTIYFMDFFFNEGSRVAKESVDILKKLGIKGFRLGSTKFEDRNENVMMGE